jgi:hypothetical protein
MANCTGVVYGLVTGADDGKPISDVRVQLNWVQRAEGGPLKIGGNDALTTFVPYATTTSAGEYVIPFFWASELVPGTIASALAIRFYSDNSYTSMNKHGLVFMGVDVKKLLGAGGYSPVPTSAGSGASMFLKFYLAATDDLKKMGTLKKIVDSTKLISAELQGVYCGVDFSLPYAVGSYYGGY